MQEISVKYNNIAHGIGTILSYEKLLILTIEVTLRLNEISII
jgi:hypothetical protein